MPSRARPLDGATCRPRGARADAVQVAGLVRKGLSNRDIAARPFVSPRTVGFRLGTVFAKLAGERPDGAGGPG